MLLWNIRWALYNTTDFGEGVEDTTTVISVSGTDINTCTPSGRFPALANVHSVNFLGNMNYQTDGIVIYSLPYFLGGTWTPAIVNGGMGTAMPPATITAFPLGSFAITGTNAWVLCGDTNTPCRTGVCVNMRNYPYLYMQRNPSRDTTLPNGWPKTIRQISTVTANDCATYPSPPVPIRSGRSVSKNIEIDISTSA